MKDKGNISRFHCELLEDRRLMAADATTAIVANATTTADSSSTDAAPELVADNFGLDDAFLASFDAQSALDDRISIALPVQLTDGLRVPVEVNGRTQTLVLERAQSTRAEDFQVLLQQTDGSFIEFNAGQETNYVGFVEELPGISVRAVFSSRGLTAEANQANGGLAWNITPDDSLDADGNPIHAISFTDVFAQLEANHDHDGDGVADHAEGEHTDPEEEGPHGPGCTCDQCTGILNSTNTGTETEAAALSQPIAALAAIAASTSEEEQPLSPPLAASAPFINVPNNPASRAQVFNTIQVREAVIGFDVTNEALREGYDDTSGPNSNNNQLDTQEEVDRAVQRVLDNIALFLTTDERVSSGTVSPNTLYLRDGFVHQVAGTIIIRTSLAADPYAGQNGSAAGNADINSGLLNQFRNRWNSNVDSANVGLTRAGDVNRSQSNHDLATLLGGSAGSADGLAFVGTVNESFRYSISDGSRDGFWRGVARHEIGHTFGLPHFGDSNRRAEFDPAGNGIGIFDPTGRRIALTTDEQATVQGEVNSSNLPLVNAGTSLAGTFTAHDVRPNALRDDVTTIGSAPLVIDVLANDSDANNDPLFLDRYQAVTEAGGSVSVSIGGGDTGQDVLLYTPPTGFFGTDSFFYDIADVPTFGDGNFRTFGLVTIEVENPNVTINTNETLFVYDLGPAQDAVLFPGSSLLSPLTTGDVFFSGGSVSALDRGTTSGQNQFNRDFIEGTTPATFNHVLAPGEWRVVVNLGDPGEAVDNQVVRAEGQTILTDIDSSAGQAGQTMIFNVLVTDGQLNLEFSDADNVNPRWVVNRIMLTRIGNVPLIADFDSSGDVDSLDLAQWVGDFGQNGSSDADADGDSDGADFLAWQRNFNPAETFTLLDANNGNGGLVTNATENSDGDASTNLETGLVTNNNGRALVSSSSSSIFVDIPGWRAQRTQYNGGNAAFGFDGSNLVGSEPAQYVFVNAGSISLTSDPIVGNFTTGSEFDLSFFTEQTSDTGAVTATLTFDTGESHTFSTFDTTTTAAQFADSYTLFNSASSVVISFDLTTEEGGAQLKADSIALEITTTSPPLTTAVTIAAARALEPTEAESSGLTPAVSTTSLQSTTSPQSTILSLSLAGPQADDSMKRSLPSFLSPSALESLSQLSARRLRAVDSWVQISNRKITTGQLGLPANPAEANVDLAFELWNEWEDNLELTL